MPADGILRGLYVAPPGCCTRSTASRRRAFTSRRSTPRRSPAASTSRAGLAGPGGRRRVAADRLDRDPAGRAPPRAFGGDRGRSRGRDRRQHGAPVERAAARRARHDARRPRDARAHGRGALRRAVARERAHAARAPGAGRPLDAGPLRQAAALHRCRHGFAGNVLALLGAPDGSTTPRAVEAQAVATARAFAHRRWRLANWRARSSGSRTGDAAAGAVVPRRRGHRHVARPRSRRATKRTARCWRPAANSSGAPGPIARSAGLCHGTAGNGFAFLALFERTGDERWLDGPARSRCTRSTKSSASAPPTGRGRYALFTGDVGAALFAAACLDGRRRFPGLDDL